MERLTFRCKYDGSAMLKSGVSQSVLDCLADYEDAEERGELVRVVRGRWIDKNAGNATCSVCKRRHRDVYDDDASDLFCRSCGAKMEVQDDN